MTTPAAEPPLMTACACTGVTFDDIERRMREDGLTAAQAELLTGAGSLCTACLPDLRAHLMRRPGPWPR